MSYHLHKAGISFKVINDPTLQSASSVASGVINPVTGRRIVQTWMIETILPYVVKAYQNFAHEMDCKIIKASPIILIHPSQQMQESFEFRMQNENVYLFKQDPTKWNVYFETPNGMGAINECYWIDLNTMISKWQSFLINKQNYIATRFEINDITFLENEIVWNNIHAERIIFCDGLNAMNNPYFSKLPFSPNKGEALIIKVPGLSKENIYKSSVTMVPWKDDLFWVGSSYEWEFNNTEPTPAFKEKMTQSLDQFLKLPYQIVDHIVGIRPANTQRRPFVGVHPTHKQLSICNGMGTKGCSLAPYFTNELLNLLEYETPVEQEASLKRFESLLTSLD
jgi:hypothetical protein